ncbi:FAD-binding oxidoreductase [Curtobacterium sp. MCJR17_055]|uniref:FAD-binding oxidoreductase n=1 Tax=unclassified Curtobacterium TaxID=257496 RepID=UPI000D8BCF07|nr:MULTISPECIES: FAD-binding oxidoreductase [unclassified Curtobacterium]PYY33553.1 FAD-binding oxidoreductase [Curtobacterium sp. MCBD17_029]PYY53389.1 FAD-binding oxidoreductase [Curtobacterium sp. MCJR17_055]PYY57315.1 FAD-binding oxidoreductase [Curtobacterium sp. MCPF17_015]
MTIVTPVSVSPTTIEALRAELVDLLGERGVSADERTRARASVDEATMSPILSEQLPLGLADLVASPANADEIAATLHAAVRHGVPVTTRGKGTGNYGQGIPLHGGLVLDTSRARAVVEVGDGWITAEAGTSMVALEQAAAAAGQQLWMYPSTAQSTIGGFLSGGSGGTGSIAHGSNWQGFVTALDIALPGEPGLRHVEGDEAQPFVHTYGTAGVIARATVRLEPLQDWRAVYATFPTFEQALVAVRTLRGLTPVPRLVSADRAAIAATLPTDPAIAADRASLRGIIDAAALDEAQDLITFAGGTVEDVREGLQQTTKVSMLSYNHPIWWLKRNTPDTEYFHVEVGGEALIDRIAEVEAVYPGGMLHIEAAHLGPIGMLTAPYTGAEDVYAGYPLLRDLGVRVHSPHQYYVDHGVEELLALKQRTDPDGLLNPGHVIDPSLVESGGSTASAQPAVPGFGK